MAPATDQDIADLRSKIEWLERDVRELKEAVSGLDHDVADLRDTLTRNVNELSGRIDALQDVSE